MGKGKKVTTGFRYYLGMQFGLSHAMDELTDIYVDDKFVWQGSQKVSGRISINAPYVLGGDKYEGGVVGDFDLCMGESTAVANDYLTSILGPKQPAYRNRVTGVFRRGQTGANSRSPRGWGFRGNRSLAGWDGPVWNPTQAQILLANGTIKAMNAAHIYYETITNRLWGMGLSSSCIDIPSFTAGANTFYNEGLGLCLKFAQDKNFQDWIQVINEHASCVLVQDPSTGLFRIKPIRDDYDVTSLTSLTQDDTLEVISFQVGTTVGATNQLTVNWHDPVTNTDRSKTVKALGNIQGQGGVVPDSKDLPGISTADLASRCAQRDLRPMAVGPARLQAKFKRTARLLVPGEVFLWTYPPYGIVNMVFRVGDYDPGTLTDGAITLTCVQDVFSMPDNVYVAEQPGGWVPSDPTPQPSPAGMAFEVPYRDLAQIYGSAQAQAFPTLAGYLALCSQRPTNMSRYYELWTAPTGSAFAQANSSGDWCPSGSLAASVGYLDKSIVIVDGFDLSFIEVGTAAFLEQEVVRVDAIDPTTGAATFARGCLDTVPVPHPANAQIWFYDNDSAVDPTQYTSGENVGACALTVTSQGQLDIKLAPVDNVVMNERAARPYPPGNLQIQGVAYPTDVEGALAISWAHRDRLLQDDQIIDTTQASIGPEPGTSYVVAIYLNGQQDSTTPVTGTSLTPSVSGDGVVEVTITAVRAGITSWQSLNATFNYTRGQLRLTQDGDTRVTEAGIDRILES